MALQSLFTSVIFYLRSKILSNISYGGRFRASLVLTYKMMYSGLYRKIGLILLGMSLTLAPFTLTVTLCFQDSRPGCKPETTESPVVPIVPSGHG